MDKNQFAMVVESVLDCYVHLTTTKRNKMKNELNNKFDKWKNESIQGLMKKVTDYINSQI